MLQSSKQSKPNKLRLKPNRMLLQPNKTRVNNNNKVNNNSKPPEFNPHTTSNHLEKSLTNKPKTSLLRPWEPSTKSQRLTRALKI